LINDDEREVFVSGSLGLPVQICGVCKRDQEETVRILTEPLDGTSTCAYCNREYRLSKSKSRRPKLLCGRWCDLGAALEGYAF
jgi:hypothetical protein